MRRRLALTAGLSLVAALAFQAGAAAPAGAGGAYQVRAFGGARALGAPGGALNAPLGGIAATRRGHGYWLATANGHVLHFGDARTLPGVASPTPIVGLARTATGAGLWLVASNGAVYTSGRARYAGGAAGGLVQAAGIARGAHGYWVALGPSGPPLPPNSGTG